VDTTLTHFNAQGRAHMVDISAKESTQRTATAYARIFMKAETLQLIRDGKMKKGDVLAVSQVAGIMGAKKTWDLIPMCHPLSLTGVDIRFEEVPAEHALDIYCTVKTKGPTGVEMEALTAVSLAALTVYDMCKAVDRDMVITSVCLLEKSGGKSGEYKREEGERRVESRHSDSE
jgi:cyclic pyranopterin monophosphate synthase